MNHDNSRLFDDITRVASGAFNVFGAIAKQIQDGSPFGNNNTTKTDNDDITRLQGVISKLRIEQEELKNRVTELEKLIGIKKSSIKKTSTLKKKTVKK